MKELKSEQAGGFYIRPLLLYRSFGWLDDIMGATASHGRLEFIYV